MNTRIWWNQNKAYLSAWACHTIPLFIFAYGVRGLHLLGDRSARFPDYAWQNIAFIVIYSAISFFLYRFVVYAFLYRRDPALLPPPGHPYSKYIMGWFVYIMLSIGASIILGFLAMISTYLIQPAHTIVTFYIFRMAVKKYTCISPNAGHEH